MPFITEEIWQLLEERKNGESIMISAMPKPTEFDNKFISGFEVMKEAFTHFRTIRKNINKKFSDQLIFQVDKNSSEYDESLEPILIKLCNVIKGKVDIDNQENTTVAFFAKNTKFIVDVGTIDIEAEISKLKNELKYHKGFLVSIKKKLDNKNFIQNAPESVIIMEQKKQDDAENKIKSIEERLAGMLGKH
jgi:valyl-tRNA synthetase